MWPLQDSASDSASLDRDSPISDSNSPFLDSDSSFSDPSSDSSFLDSLVMYMTNHDISSTHTGLYNHFHIMERV